MSDAVVLELGPLRLYLPPEGDEYWTPDRLDTLQRLRTTRAPADADELVANALDDFIRLGLVTPFIREDGETAFRHTDLGVSAMVPR